MGVETVILLKGRVRPNHEEGTDVESAWWFSCHCPSTVLRERLGREAIRTSVWKTFSVSGAAPALSRGAIQSTPGKPTLG